MKRNTTMIRHLHIRNPYPRRQHQQGFGIVELMVAMALGLFLVGGAISVFVTNQQAYRTTEQLSRMQESGRTAVELMARQVREAGGSPCGGNLPTAVTINSDPNGWMWDWGNGIRGFDDDDAIASNIDFGTDEGERIEDTDAVLLIFGNSNSGVQIVKHNASAATIFVNTVDHGIEQGEIVMICNYEQAAIFQVTNPVNSDNVNHQTGNTVSPGNCTKGLGYPTVCTTNGNEKEFVGGTLMRLSSQVWYIGANSRGGRSLFRARLFNNGGTPDAVREEIAEGVTNLQMTYLQLDAAGALPSDYVDAGAITDWKNVTAARITLTLQSLQNVGTDGSPLQRTMTHVVSLRNRLP